MKRLFLMGVAALALGAAAAQADTLSFRGTFQTDDDQEMFSFSITEPSTVTIRTFSFAGGTQADGTVIPAGGFDPVLSLFDGADLLIAENDDGAGVPVDGPTGKAYDALIVIDVAPGDYTVVLTQYDNFLDGDLGDPMNSGFVRAGETTFTQAFAGVSSGMFYTAEGIQRTENWALDISTVIPTPSAAMLGGVCMFVVVARRRRQPT